MMATPRVRLRIGRDDYCRIDVNDTLSAVSPVLKAVVEEEDDDDDEPVVDLRARIGLRTPPSRIVALFMDFLSRGDEVAPLALLPHTAPLLEVADFLGVDTGNQLNVEKWIGARTTAAALYARTHLARRAKCHFFVTKMMIAWFEYFSCATEICFVSKRAVPHHHFKNELNHLVDGEPFMHVLNAPYNHGIRPFSPTTRTSSSWTRAASGTR